MMDTELIVRALFLCAGSLVSLASQPQQWEVFLTVSIELTYNQEMLFFVKAITSLYLQDGVTVQKPITLQWKKKELNGEPLREL